MNSPSEQEVRLTQSLFDTIAKHLLTQNQQAVEMVAVDGEVVKKCRYRSSDGLKCAVGCLIKDDLYDIRFEGSCVSWNPGLRHILQESLGRAVYEQEIVLLADLQEVHDDLLPSKWPEALADVAKRYGLTFNEEVPST